MAATPVLSQNKVPHLAEGWHDTGPRENAIFVGGKRAGVGTCHPKPRRRLIYHELRVTIKTEYQCTQ